MCGIVGLCDLSGRDPVDTSLLAAMARSISHRGPDDDGCWLGDSIGLGHRRLSIIDLESGDQPMASADGSLVLVFNGEIYNHVELRQDLERGGSVFRTRSDTEVILHAYDRYGVACVEHLRGMFAFALWDVRRRELFLARDHFGKKPLYLADDGRRLAFASEIKALLELPWVDTTWDASGLRAFLALGYTCGEHSAYRGIRRLKPGSCELWRLPADGAARLVRNWRYWRPRMAEHGSRLDGASRPSYDEAVADLLRLLAESVRLRLRSDVPLGAFLSGGVDSSAVVALMRVCGVNDVRTFSIGFEAAAQSELTRAAATAQALETTHCERIVTAADASRLAELLEGFDEPFADDSAIPTYFVSRLAREHVTVALSGDGGDELFAGYDQYLRLRRLAVVDRLPLAVRQPLSRVGATLVPRSVRGGRFVRDLGVHPERRTLALALPNEFDLRGALQEGFIDYLREAGDDGWINDFVGPPTIAGMQAVDQRTYLPDDILVKVDRASMANSLEVRCPLLDVRLAEYVNHLPSDYKLRSGVTKAVLRSAVGDIIPAHVLSGPKRGFGMPLREWLRGPLEGFVRERLTEGAGDLFSSAGVAEVLGESHGRLPNWERRVWALLSLAVWATKQPRRPW